MAILQWIWVIQLNQQKIGTFLTDATHILMWKVILCNVKKNIRKVKVAFFENQDRSKSDLYMVFPN